jgi:hypothetical protein
MRLYVETKRHIEPAAACHDRGAGRGGAWARPLARPLCRTRPARPSSHPLPRISFLLIFTPAEPKYPPHQLRTAVALRIWPWTFALGCFRGFLTPGGHRRAPLRAGSYSLSMPGLGARCVMRADQPSAGRSGAALGQPLLRSYQLICSGYRGIPCGVWRVAWAGPRIMQRR